MRKKFVVVGVAILVLGGILAGFFAVSWIVRRRAFENNYAHVEIGDSESTVVDFFGQPDETSDCSAYRHSGSLEVIEKRCTRVYRYTSFMQEWIFYFDNDGILIHKAHNVSH
jgi:hypothetical protein